MRFNIWTFYTHTYTQPQATLKVTDTPTSIANVLQLFYPGKGRHIAPLLHDYQSALLREAGVYAKTVELSAYFLIYKITNAKIFAQTNQKMNNQQVINRQ